jgi:hypothetical protein
MLFRRRRNTGDGRRAGASSLRSAIADTAWYAQDRLIVGLRQGVPAAVEVVKWPVERLVWALQRGLVWRLEDRAGELGAPARAVSFGALMLLAAAVGVAGLLWTANPGGKTPPVALQAVEVAAPQTPVPAAAEPEPQPTLAGAAPVFKPAAGKGSDRVDEADEPATATTSADSAVADEALPSSSPAAGTEGEAASSSSAAKAAALEGPPAGPEAIAVARDFATAFVLYETGETEMDVRRVFQQTATPELARALLRRPPRLPANVEVPEAKVLNVVPAPSHGKVYPVSVSLLRVGLTSELRLEMEQLKGDRWQVTNVLG